MMLFLRWPQRSSADKQPKRRGEKAVAYLQLKKVRNTWPQMLLVFLADFLSHGSFPPLGWVLLTYPLGFLCQLKLRF